ncbi:hypothetical protein [Pseudaminobacter sp. NGMCC 1.201702]|uniref:hypothetical protein n=1 Tax=Pseudaminobacter sp. NGMCC 1.201702 TaxID=3391825 RepID=UPI0039EF3AEC
MVDSDHSMSLRVVTRRQLLTGATGLALRADTQAAPGQGSGAGPVKPDEVVVAWRQWRNAHARTLRLGRRQQRLENELMARVGFPMVILPERQAGKGATAAFSTAEIEAFFDDNSIACQHAKAQLATHQAGWNAAAVESGYMTALQDEAAAEQHEQAVAARLFAWPASTLAGIQAKLDVMLRQAPCGSDDQEFPWPQLRAVSKDVANLVAGRE